MSRYQLTDEVKEKFIPIVKKFIEDLEAVDLETAKDLLEKDFSDTELNPYTLGVILKDLGYDDEDGIDTNGWQMDFWIKYRKCGFRSIEIKGCGITFELKLSEMEE